MLELLLRLRPLRRTQLVHLAAKGLGRVLSGFLGWFMVI
jgi:hypothetical protein